MLVDQMDGTLVTIAKDVKVQVDFNPAAAVVGGMEWLRARRKRPTCPGALPDDDLGSIATPHSPCSTRAL